MLHFTVAHPLEHCGSGVASHGEGGIGCNSPLLRPTASQLSIGRRTHLEPLRAKDQTFFQLFIVEVDFFSAHDRLLLWTTIIPEDTTTFNPSIVKDYIACVKWFGVQLDWCYAWSIYLGRKLMIRDHGFHHLLDDRRFLIVSLLCELWVFTILLRRGT